MKTIKIIFNFTIIASVFLLSSCSKDSDSPGSKMIHSFNYPDAAGVLIATKSYTYDINGGYLNAIEATSVSAVFPASGNFSAGKDAGTVSVQTKELSKSSSNIYTFQDLPNQLGLYGNMSLQWNVTGGPDVPSFSFMANKGIPSFNGLAELPLYVSKGSGAIVDFYGKVAYADSVLVTISGNNGSVYKVFPASEPNGQFTSAELKGLPETKAATFSVIPFNVQDAWVNSSRYCFINETAYYKVNIEIGK